MCHPVIGSGYRETGDPWINLLCHAGTATPRVVDGASRGLDATKETHPMAEHDNRTRKQAEREQFLAEPHTATLSVSLGAHRGPLAVPIWYHYTPGGRPWVLTGAGTRKAQTIEAAGFFSLMAQRLEPSRRYVAVDGAVSRIDRATDDQIENLTRRYLDGAAAKRHIDFLHTLGEHLVITMSPGHWLYSDAEAF